MPIKNILLLALFPLSIFAGELPFVSYPFHAARGILCDQGAQSPAGNSHTFSNTLYALDLATPKGSDPAGIYASRDGVVISFGECQEHNTNCGNGFGNHVKILSDDGVLVMYAHLASVSVATGSLVRTGDFIGVEGNTGLTGHDNRHLHFSVHFDWRVDGFEYYEKNLGYLPSSVPYQMNICQPKHGTCGQGPLDIRELQCKRVTGETEWVSPL
jgi:murein DD-endopeptidase MepM/ murein hydrolase activator NlpD